MGRNNKARRAAKQRKRAADAARRAAQHRPGSGTGSFDPLSGLGIDDLGWWDDIDEDWDDLGMDDWPSDREPFRPYVAGAEEKEVARALVSDAVRLVSARKERAAARRHAEWLLAPGAPTRPDATLRAADSLLAELVAGIVRHGWSPADLGEIARRRVTDRHIAVLAHALRAHAAGYTEDKVGEEWRAQLADLGPAHRSGDRGDIDSLELVIGLGALLVSLPPITEIVSPPGTAPRPSRRRAPSGDNRQLARVRALLAKAESSTFPEEAEALSAKAQELIARHSLDLVLEEAGADQPPGDVVTRRLWLDAPYVMAKAALVDVVAAANRSRAVIFESLGFVALVGRPEDLDAVELLVTSLLVQADVALLRADAAPVTRRGSTTSFRRSFLLAYGARIGERLREASEEALQQSGRTGELVPLLARHQEQVDRTFDELFPHLRLTQPSIGNAAGWAAGRAAADRATLDPRGRSELDDRNRGTA